ncbi:hypothetical protein OUY22_18100, partial [Nonomuraea sp. MCN248]
FYTIVTVRRISEMVMNPPSYRTRRSMRYEEFLPAILEARRSASAIRQKITGMFLDPGLDERAEEPRGPAS